MKWVGLHHALYGGGDWRQWVHEQLCELWRFERLRYGSRFHARVCPRETCRRETQYERKWERSERR